MGGGPIHSHIISLIDDAGRGSDCQQTINSLASGIAPAIWTGLPGRLLGFPTFGRSGDRAVIDFIFTHGRYHDVWSPPCAPYNHQCQEPAIRPVACICCSFDILPSIVPSVVPSSVKILQTVYCSVLVPVRYHLSFLSHAKRSTSPVWFEREVGEVFAHKYVGLGVSYIISLSYMNRVTPLSEGLVVTRDMA